MNLSNEDHIKVSTGVGISDPHYLDAGPGLGV